MEPFELVLKRKNDFHFDFQYDPQQEPISLDEGPPLGAGEGPSPSKLLAAAVGHCLSASLLFCLSKSRVEIADLTTRVKGQFFRNEQGRWRIQSLDAHLIIDLDSGQIAKLKRCFTLFEDFCVVTASVRQGIAVNVKVTLPTGEILHQEPKLT